MLMLVDSTKSSMLVLFISTEYTTGRGVCSEPWNPMMPNTRGPNWVNKKVTSRSRKPESY